MKKKIIQSFFTVFSIGILVIGVLFLFSEKTETTSKEEKKVVSQKEESSKYQSSEVSKEKSNTPEQYIFDRTLFYEEDVTMVVDLFKEDLSTAGSFTFSMALASNIFTDMANGQTTSSSYSITSDNIKVETNTGDVLTGSELYVHAGDSVHSIIESRELDDEDASDVSSISYTFEAEKVKTIQIALVDDEGKEMVVSEWIDLLQTTAAVFTSPEIFTSFLLSEGANQSEQYLFQQVNEDHSSKGKFKYFINFNTLNEEGLAGPGESYALSKDGKVYTYSIYNDEGRDWRHSEEWTNKIANFDPERWLWEDGVKEQVIASLMDDGYVEEDNYYFVPNKNTDDYSYTYEVVILDKEYGYNPIHVVNVNNKTGDYHN